MFVLQLTTRSQHIAKVFCVVVVYTLAPLLSIANRTTTIITNIGAKRLMKIGFALEACRVLLFQLLDATINNTSILCSI